MAGNASGRLQQFLIGACGCCVFCCFVFVFVVCLLFGFVSGACYRILAGGILLQAVQRNVGLRFVIAPLFKMLKFSFV